MREVLRIPTRSPWPIEFVVDDEPFDPWAEAARVVRAELDRREAERPLRAVKPPERCPPRG